MAKYFKGSVITATGAYPYFVWNGERDWRSAPPWLKTIEALGRRPTVVLLPAAADDLEVVLDPIAAGFDCVIVWARDDVTYRATVERFKALTSAVH